jgi:hypothetical protein
MIAAGSVRAHSFAPIGRPRQTAGSPAGFLESGRGCEADATTGQRRGKRDLRHGEESKPPLTCLTG